MPDLPIEKKPFAHLQFAFNNLFNNPIILFPFSLLAFVQLFFLELIYFAPRYPLSRILAPLIQKRAGETFLHYPFNYLLLSEWFQKIQLPIFIFLTSFLLGCAVAIIQSINDNQETNLKAIFKNNFHNYIHLIIANVTAVFILYGLSFLQQLMTRRVYLIDSKTGIYNVLKQIVILGDPYFQLLSSVLATTLLAFVIPIIVIENKSIISAVALNFRRLRESFWFTFMLLLLPVLIYVPLLMLKTNLKVIDRFVSPELYGGLIILNTMVLIFIDAVQCTAVTTFYLYRRESE